MSKYRVFSGSYFPAFSPGTGKYRSEDTPYLDTFHAMLLPQYIAMFWTMVPQHLITSIEFFGIVYSAENVCFLLKPLSKIHPSDLVREYYLELD